MGEVGAVIRATGRAVKCLSRIEKSQFLTDRNVTRRWAGRTIRHRTDGGTGCGGQGAVKPAAAGGGGPQGQALRRLARRRENRNRRRKLLGFTPLTGRPSERFEKPFATSCCCAGSSFGASCSNNKIAIITWYPSPESIRRRASR